MNKEKIKTALRERRHQRVRVKVAGTAQRPRLSVYRSLDHIYVQLIDDVAGKTLIAESDKTVKAGKTKTEKARLVGKLVAEKALAKKIEQAVFDRGWSKFHGRVKAVAEGAKEAGLKI
ncbi:50S ribosomal protein L18 [Candidatus Falkowbacteria bacterium]|nr:50S ribosomal protein L18 [Candidatus Falkowbacteria bacterium]